MVAVDPRKLSTPAGFVALAATLCALAVAALHGSALQHGWAYDDSQILKHALSHSPWGYFTQPQQWRALVTYSFTPWLSLAYDLDLALFGLQPWGFHAHNLLMVTAAATLLACALRAWVRPDIAVGAALLWLAGSPVTAAAQQLMVRHYAEGLMWLLLAVVALQRHAAVAGSAPRPLGQRRWLVMSVLALAISVSCKEVFLPMAALPLLLPLSPVIARQRWRERIVPAVAWLAVVPAYLAWRAWMLGSAVGGGATPLADLLASGWQGVLPAVAGLPALVWPAWAQGVVGALLIAALFAARRGATAVRTPFAERGLIILGSLAAAAASLSVLMPLALAGQLTEGRYAFVPWTLAVAAVAVALGALSNAAAGMPWMRPVPPLALHASVALALAVLALGAWRVSAPFSERVATETAVYRAHADLVLNGSRQDVLRISAEVYPYFPLGLRDIRRLQGRDDGPHFATDEVELAPLLRGPEGATRRVWGYEPAAQRLVDEREAVLGRLAAWQGQVQAGLAESSEFSIRFRYEGGPRIWRWQVEAPGAQALHFVSEGVRTTIPAAYAIRSEERPSMCFRVRVDGPGPMVRYSPRLRLPPPGADGVAEVVWRGVAVREPVDPACETGSAP